ncbi:DUF1552 domain-containing protein [Lignipirellula cremea]|uniref:DUF1552 domain-containing protein n=1 Tax=Lignipirellula cremea TaxID=2528010 RepID=A0A518E2Q0_9BACT|nr:DUF1552 domain-containing protein [Lignipirellula cremea]QDU98367.1 hypothetical protein Pla8534_62350 [Lignipirellula cremea]
MTFHRRDILQGFSLGAGSLVLSPLLRGLQAEAAGTAALPKRFVFMLQPQGLQSWAVQPAEIDRPRKGGVEQKVVRSLQDLTLADDLQPLARHQARLSVLQGLNGRHVFPYHGGPFGALGGFLKGRTPEGETIDAALARALPATFRLLGLGVGSDENASYCSSAWGENQAAPTLCNQSYAYDVLFGSVLQGEDRAQFESQGSLLDFLKEDVKHVERRLAGEERRKFEAYVGAFETLSQRQQELKAMETSLRKIAPRKDGKYAEPLESLQVEAHAELGAAALIAGLTNVVTICSGLCKASGLFRGYTEEPIDMHPILGHDQGGRQRELLSLLRRHHLEQLAVMADRLDAVPEGDGTMLDNTVFVYTSDFGETHHSSGSDWAFVLLGGLGGRLKTGQYLDYPLVGNAGNRSINALYCTLLHAAGAPRDHFNLDGVRKTIDAPGPLDELLA